MADQITQVLGIVAMSNKGEYNSQTDYEKLNVVTYNGSSYCAKQNCKGKLPTDPDYWQLLAEKGETGATGEQGPMPTKGVDYYTPEDVEEFSNTIKDTVHQDMEQSVGQITNGSPLIAASTSDMLDTTRLYVNTTDGYVYYYDGSIWVRGWIYQATEDSDTVDNIDRTLQNININYYSPDLVYSGMLSSTGVVTSQTAKYAKVPIVSNQTYYLYRKSQIYSRTGDYVGFLDNQDNLSIKTFKECGIITLNDITYVKIEVPLNISYLLFNVKLNAFDETDTAVLSKYHNYSELNGYDVDLRTFHNINKENYYNNLKVDNLYNYIVPTETPIEGLLYSNGNCCSKINVEPGETYYLYRKSQRYNIQLDNLCFGNEEYEFNSLVELRSLTSKILPNGAVVKKIDIPIDTTHVYINLKLNLFDDVNSTIFSKFPTNRIINASDNDLRHKFENIDVSTLNRLKNKKWLTLGDSITALTYRSTKNYHDYISERTGCIVTNWGDSGKGYITGNNLNKSMCDYVDNLTGDEGFDYITIFAGTNDRSQTIGTISDTEKTTIYGAIKYCVNKIIQMYPNAKIGLLTPLPRSSNYGTDTNNSLYKIVKAIQEVGAYYSIPVLDQYTKSGLRPWNADNNRTYFSCEQAPNGDGLHPNELGHEWISYPIENFLQIL